MMTAFKRIMLSILIAIISGCSSMPQNSEDLNKISNADALNILYNRSGTCLFSEGGIKDSSGSGQVIPYKRWSLYYTEWPNGLISQVLFVDDNLKIKSGKSCILQSEFIDSIKTTIEALVALGVRYKGVYHN
ncbi:MAG: hypothetical protein H7839_14640 [Magnetococcus sp. YQC-5]